MIVRIDSLDSVLETLKSKKVLSLDTETTGLRPYHGDKVFSLTMSDGEETYYFNFKDYGDEEGFDKNYLLVPLFMLPLRPLFEDGSKLWFMHNAKFDLAFLHMAGFKIKGQIHCTQAIGRVEYNEHLSYSLDSCLSRIGLEKDDAVMLYINEHKLYEKVPVEGKEVEEKRLFFDKVPFSIIVPYGEKDALNTYTLGCSQIKSIAEKDHKNPPGLPKMKAVMENETRLTKTVFNMESSGVKVDLAYCKRAARYENDRRIFAESKFYLSTGSKYIASGKVLAEVFESDRKNWVLTEKGNPSFTSDVIKNFENPVAKFVLEIRDAKARADFYRGFIHHADSFGIVHPNFNPGGTTHGRFSSSSPNFQNLTSDEGDEDKEFIIRRAIIPRDDFIFIMPDYDQMEYRFLLELCCRLLGHETDLVKRVKSGLDVHEATAQAASSQNLTITRDQAKTSNFLTIYGGGAEKLAKGLKCSVEQAHEIRNAIFRAAPEMKDFVRSVTKAAEKRGYIFNWLGRRCEFPVKDFSYRATNYLVSGGCADVMKVAMNRMDDYLTDKKSRLLMTIHDEVLVEVAESEIEEVPKKIKEIMETSFESKYLPLTAGMEWSPRSLGDKIKGFPPLEARNEIQTKHGYPFSTDAQVLQIFSNTASFTTRGP